jgi:hypothetical protein
VLSRHRVEGDTVAIGRGYGNDIILDDPHVAAAHLRIRRDAAGLLVAEDLGSLNGLYLEGVAHRLERTALDGRGAIRIGHTLLRIRGAEHPVPAERPIVVARRRWPVLALLAAVILGIELIGAWRGDFREPKLATYIQPLLVVIATIAVWVGFWTLVSRIAARAARFEAHLTIGLVTMLALSLANEVADFGAFGFSLPGLAEARFATSFVAMGLAALAHMRVIGPGRMRWKLAGAAALPVLVIGYHSVIDAEADRATDPPSFVRLLMPPALRLSPLKTEDQFLADLGRMRARLERNRAEDKP